MKVKKYQAPLALKPTQFAVGLLEVEYKALQIKKMKSRKLKNMVRGNPIPVVISPWGELCVIDHHHLLFALWHAGVAKVRIKVVKDYSRSRLTYGRFWRKMARENKTYLYDQFGNGPQRALYLPLDVRGMADDPYRSLAWMVRQEGGYENSDQTFVEFRWADFFRAHGLLESQGRRGFQEALRKGLRLARSKEASKLPGFIGTKKKRDAGGKSVFIPKAHKKGRMAAKPALKK